MGCDIHPILEQLTPLGWVGIHEYPYFTDHDRWAIRARNYQLFAALAGVRGEGPDPKGLPPDASMLTVHRSARYGEGGHSHSYCSVSEFMRLYIQCSGDTLRNEWIAAKLRGGDDYVAKQRELLDLLFPAMSYNDYDPKLADYRVVFWFDN